MNIKPVKPKTIVCRDCNNTVSCDSWQRVFQSRCILCEQDRNVKEWIKLKKENKANIT